MTSSPEAQLAHYLINISLVALLVSSGLVMLFLVYRKIRTRDEWRHNSVAFLSIWGHSCLFGTAWVLGFLDFGPLTDFVLFLSCILTSFQGQPQLCLSLPLCVSVFSRSLYLCLSLSVSVYLSVSLSASLCLCLSVCVSVCLSLSLYICLCLSVCVSLSVSLCKYTHNINSHICKSETTSLRQLWNLSWLV